MEPLRFTATALVSEPPQTFVAFSVYLNCSSTGPLPDCVGMRGMDFVPLGSTEPPGSNETASALVDFHGRTRLYDTARSRSSWKRHHSRVRTRNAGVKLRHLTMWSVSGNCSLYNLQEMVL